jgi:hypothetical protein
MAAYTVNVELNAEQNRRLLFLATQWKGSRRGTAYQLLTTALADTVVGDKRMRPLYEKWVEQTSPAHKQDSREGQDVLSS